MHLQLLAIDGVYRATPARKGTRNYDWFRRDALSQAVPGDWQAIVATTYTGLPGEVVGLHCEAGHRVVTCVSGRVALVVVDLRVGAPTFGRWIPIDLDTVERVSVVIPPDTAWGFQAVTAGAALLGLHSDIPDGLVVDPGDESLQIAWPLPLRATTGVPLAQIIHEFPR